MKKIKTKEYLLEKADSAMALWLVFFGTLCDSIFLFIPPEVFMTPPIVANKKKAFPAVLAASAGSLIGAVMAYLIGMWLYDSVGRWIINVFSSPLQFEAARQMFIAHGLLVIAIGAFTPVPFKLLTICAGFIGFDPLLYLGATAVGRTLRFAIAGFLLWKFQEQANAIVRKYFWPLMMLAVIAALLGIALMMMM
jgi:membrane protein YqaA with SNARE-associated domain